MHGRRSGSELAPDLFERRGAAMRMSAPLVDPAPATGPAIEPPGPDDVARQPLRRQLAHRGRQGMRSAAAVGIEQLDQTDIARGAGADELLPARPGARHDERLLVEGQDL